MRDIMEFFGILFSVLITIFLVLRTLVSFSPDCNYVEMNGKLFLKVNTPPFKVQTDIKQYGFEPGYYKIGEKVEIK